MSVERAVAMMSASGGVPDAAPQRQRRRARYEELTREREAV